MARPKEFDVNQALGSALDAFWENGYVGTSMNDLTSRMGIQKASLYDTYGDKRRLFITALLRYQNEHIAFVRDLFGTTPDPTEAILAYLDSAICYQGEPGRCCLVVNTYIELAPQDPEIAIVLAEYGAELREILLEACNKGQELGQFRADCDAALLVESVINSKIGLAVLTLGKARAEFPEFEFLKSAALRSIAA